MPFGGGSPQTFSQGGNPAPYIPKAQPQADQAFQTIVQQLIGSLGNNFSGTPAGQVYPFAQSLFQSLQNPVAPGTVGGTAAAQALQGSSTAGLMGSGDAAALNAAGNNILQTGIDPMQGLFARQQQQVADQANVANAMAGVAGTPYGASGVANALGNFDANWQNNLLNRQIAAGGAAAPLLTGATNLAATSTSLPYNTASQIGQGAQSALGTLTNLGNNQFLLPEQILGNLDTYLGLGQSGSGAALAAGNLGFNQTAQGIGGLLSGANSLFGSGGLFGGGGAGSALGSSLGSSLIAPGTGLGAGIGTNLLTGATSDVLGSGVPATAAATGGGDLLSSIVPFGLS